MGVYQSPIKNDIGEASEYNGKEKKPDRDYFSTGALIVVS
jgi:hypothetical protein